MVNGSEFITSKRAALDSRPPIRINPSVNPLLLGTVGGAIPNFSYSMGKTCRLVNERIAFSALT